MKETPNKSIHCTVDSCAHKCEEEDYCTLNRVEIGTHEKHPSVPECVDCNSFEKRN